MHILSVSVILASDSIFVFNKYRLTSTPFYGFLAPHHSYMKYYITSHVPAFSIEISQKTDGNKSWHQHYNNPTTGLGYLYANFGNKILGNTHGLYSFMNVPIIHRLKFNFNVQIASGLAYITQKFDADDNYLNTAIASRLNYYFNLSFDTKINLSRNIQLRPIVSLSHFSNGAIKKPNLGLNLFMAGCGFVYSFNKTEIEQKNIDENFSRKNYFMFNYSAGSKQTFAYDKTNYFISSISIDYKIQNNPISIIYFGTDFFYDNSLKMRIESQENNFNPIDSYRAGIHVGYDLKISRLSIILQIGGYCFSNFNEDGWMYDRLGLRYELNKNISVHVMLKSHLEVADFVEWGVGYRFGKRE
ncbi:MAG TPA: hypothetical protein DDX39_12405 [Bacteroidales bacterium]|nr:MAG: hypothetical protein A2W98_11815 [Bacteroidetes bacterium GWF2_33_38]HBF89435.1 hypothetical protein [Bacteroidales bacterium]